MTNDRRPTTNDRRPATGDEGGRDPSSFVLRPSSLGPGPSSLSVAIIARDEERHLGAAIGSVGGLADEVLVLLDQRTVDRSGEIARSLGARVAVERWRGFGAQRNRALELCRCPWVLFLDADERVSPELADEIRTLLEGQEDRETGDGGRETGERQETRRGGDKETGSKLSPSPPLPLSPSPPLPLTPDPYAGYWIPRYNQFFGRVARGGGWYPDHQLRLLRRGQARYDEARLVHEFATLDGPAGELRGHLLHLNIERPDELWRKQRAYAIQEAQTLYNQGRRARWRNFAGAPLREFGRRYVRLGGFRDGPLGLLLCGTLAWFEVVKFAHLKGLERAI